MSEKSRKARKKAPGERWFVYMVRCADTSLYTGIAKDVVGIAHPNLHLDRIDTIGSLNAAQTTDHIKLGKPSHEVPPWSTPLTRHDPGRRSGQAASCWRFLPQAKVVSDRLTRFIETVCMLPH
jgi:hypothetical protein